VNAKELTAAGKELAELMGWDFKHFSSHKAMPKGSIGMTDVIIVAPGQWVAFVEIKGEGDKLSERQKDFGGKLMTIGGSVKYLVVYNVDDWAILTGKE
jgi:hypothetical protein